MSDVTAQFFADLAARGHEPALGNTTGTVRYDIDDRGRTRHFLVRLDKGDITVREGAGAADAVLITDRQVFEQLAAGRVNVMAAVLRGAATADGDTELLVYAVRLFALPEPTADAEPVVSTAGRPA